MNFIIDFFSSIYCTVMQRKSRLCARGYICFYLFTVAPWLCLLSWQSRGPLKDFRKTCLKGGSWAKFCTETSTHLRISHSLTVLWEKHLHNSRHHPAEPLSYRTVFAYDSFWNEPLLVMNAKTSLQTFFNEISA